MSDPKKIMNLDGVLSPNKSFGPNKVGFLFHCYREIDGQPNSLSIKPKRNQLALIPMGVKK